MALPPSWTPPGEFDEYRLVRRLGHGAMGQVWVARDTVLDREVAIKFLSARVAEPTARQRFLLEARAIARLSHPNVVTVHRVGATGDAPYIVTELLEGQSLDRVARPLDAAQLLDVALQLGRGLAAAHRRGVLHRDVKPANAFLTSTGEVKLLDFGLARLTETLRPEPLPAAPRAPSSPPLEPDPQDTLIAAPDPHPRAASPAPAWSPGDASPEALTLEGAILGTPLYLAPEGFRGEVATTRTDVFALGAVIYELAAGLAPARYQPADRSLSERAQLPIRPLAEVAPHVSAALCAIVDRCLSRDAAHRFVDAEQVREALERLAPRAATLDAGVGNPYRGLAPWEAEHRGVFFGRITEARAVLERLKSDGAVIVTGASGVGKSSLCRAAVLPAVREGELGQGYSWKTATVLPGRHPRAALVAALAQALGADAGEIDGALAGGAVELIRWVRARLGPAHGLLLFVDQLEELITFARDDEARVLAEVLSEVTRRVPGVALLATLRHDLLTRFTELPGLGQDLTRALLLLGPISPDALRQVVTGPASTRGVTFESEAAVDRLVAFARGGGALPLLQFTLSSLWEARDVRRGVLTDAALEQLGGPEGSLGRYADGVLSALPAGQVAAVRSAVTRLVGEGLTRVRREASELSPAEREALTRLVPSRLVVVREGLAGATWELAHEALTRAWPTLRSWLSEDEVRRAVRERLTAAAAEWERLARAPEALWSARQLGEMALLRDQGLAEREMRFVATSRQRAALRRLRWPAVALAVGLAAGGAYAAVRWATAQEVEARVSVRLAAADQAIGARDAARQAADALARRAYATYDQGDWKLGETQWREVQTARAKWRAAAAQVEAESEAALVLRPDAVVRQRLADAVFGQAELGEALEAPDEVSAARARLSALDPSGELARRLDAPATLVVQTTPADAVVTVARDEQREGKAALGPERPLGDGVLPAGSWRVTARREGSATAVLPVVLQRGQTRRVSLALASRVPAGMVYVPAGAFRFGAAASDELRTLFFETVPQHEVETKGYFIGQHEVTVREWLEFLGALPPGERAARTPKPAAFGAYGSVDGLRLVEGAGTSRLELVLNGHRTSAARGEPFVYAGRAPGASQDWESFPVASVSSEDALAYAAWLERAGRLKGGRLCTEIEWERAARGADGRWFPHGDTALAADANFDETYGRKDDAFGPDAVGSHPASRSPFGLDDMMGNVWELVTAVDEPGVLIKGGSWYVSRLASRPANRWHATADFRFLDAGFRLCAPAP